MNNSTQAIKDVLANAQELYSLEQVDTAITVMAGQITAKLQDHNPILLCVMVGGLYLAGRLQAELRFPLEIDYVHATRYRGLSQGGMLQWLAKPSLPLAGRHVLIVDDILDGGVTLAEIVAYCQAQDTASVVTAVLADKQIARHSTGLAKADFSALTVPDRFVFGAGMDYQNYLRNAPGIFAVRESDA